MEFDEVLALRKSVRRYTKEIVSQEDEKAILDAAMASSVGKHNDGGYNLVVVRDREILDLIAKEEKEETQEQEKKENMNITVKSISPEEMGEIFDKLKNKVLGGND